MRNIQRDALDIITQFLKRKLDAGNQQKVSNYNKVSDNCKVYGLKEVYILAEIIGTCRCGLPANSDGNCQFHCLLIRID